MKFTKFNSSDTLWKKVENFKSDLNDEISNIVKNGMRSKNLMMKILKDPEFKVDLRVFDTRNYYRTWTRGDGSRYKDLSYIKIQFYNLPKYKKTYSTFKRLFPDEQALLDFVWERIINRPRAKYIGELSGPFGSDDSHPAYRAGGIIWIHRGSHIDYASPGILKNKWIWRLNTSGVK